MSLWDVSADEAGPPAEGLSRDRVDVAVVGGGYTGLSTALHAAGAGLSVQVIEAARVGHGGSGRNVGLVNAGVWLSPGAVRRVLGPERGGRFLDWFGDGPRRVFDLIEAHQMRCAPTRAGTIHAAHAPRAMTDLRARHAAWAALDAPVELLDRDAVRALTGSSAFHGGLLDRRAGTVNPMGYCRGLARAARGAGARIAEGVRAMGLRPDPGGGWVLATDAGSLRAGAVVLATNGYSDALWPGLARVFTPIRFVQFATRPLDGRAPRVLKDGQGVWDTGRIMVSLRRDAHDRIVIGSMGRLHGTVAGGLSRRWADRQIARLFPDLAGIGFEDAWDGVIAMTPDHLPRIATPAPNLFVPVGYNGRGITTGTLFGQAIAEFLTGRDPARLPLPAGNLAPARGGRIAAAVYDMAFTANQALRGF
ncbi:oxidoreductase [Roseivivax isoporae LMG 25204]|uniref:Oxidoreductase n=1 Tax=Roseivivax isoporae LMG 25204 TaxID=1449351 RepID=X7FD95_9RHOB|nr:oxidoreductase [Roseivivax isoporae LMG 25204]